MRVGPLLVRGAQVTVACIAAGIVAGGIGSRVVMRIAAITAPEARGAITENGNVVGAITFAGTLGLGIFVSAGAAILGAGMLLVLLPFLPRSTWLRGVAFGVALLLLGSTAVIDPGNADFTILGDRAQNIALFAALYLVYGIVASWALAALEASTPERWRTAPRAGAAVASGALAIPTLTLAALLAFTGDGIPPDGAAAVLVVGAGIAALVAGWLRGRGASAARPVEIMGWLALAAALAAGGVELVRDLDLFF